MTQIAEELYERDEPQVFEIEQPSQYAEYMIGSVPDIVAVLRSLIRTQAPVRVYFDDKKTFLLTSIVALVDDNNAIILDADGDESINRSAAGARGLILTTSDRNVKIQFVLNRISPVRHGSIPSFKSKLPKRVLRLQRRKFHRLFPIDDRIKLNAMIPRADGHLRRTELRLTDISAGGLGLTMSVEDSAFFAEGAELKDCRLTLPGEQSFSTTLCVRWLFTMTSASGAQRVRVGCEFVGLSSVQVEAVERCVHRVERERKARERGFA